MHRAVLLSRGDMTVFFTTLISGVLLGIAGVLLLITWYRPVPKTPEVALEEYRCLRRNLLFLPVPCKGDNENWIN